MFDMTQLKTRYFKVKLITGKVLEVEPPRMKALRKILSLTELMKLDTEEFTETSLDAMAEGLSIALSKNKQGYEVTEQWLTDNVPLDHMIELMTVYFNWVGEIQGSKN